MKGARCNQLMSIVSGMALMTVASISWATVVTCGVNNTENATANGSYADDCDYTTAKITTPGEITAHVNSLWGTSDSFAYVGKYNKGTGTEAGSLSGFTLTVGAGVDEFSNSYQLVVDPSWVGKTVDWVLGIKQANNSYVSYLFNDVILGIDGGFNNFWVNKQSTVVNDYSFAAGFIRVVSVPEPGTLALMGLGIVGLGISRRKKKLA